MGCPRFSELFVGRHWPERRIPRPGAACQGIVDARNALVEGQRSWNTPAALSIVARAPSLRAYGYSPMALSIVEAENWKVSAYDGFTERNPRYRLDLLWIWCAAFAIGWQQGLDDQRVLCVCISQGVQLFSRESKAGPRVRRQSMQKYQGISILFFSRQSKARPRQAVIAKWQTKQWSKKGKISAKQRSKKQVQRSVP